MLRAGDQFGIYLVEALAGEGGMAVVFRARDTKLDRPVALKLLKLSGADATARFLREARIVASLDHPDIARIYEINVSGESPYIAMEWMDGVPLDQAAAKMTTAAQVELLIAMAEVVAYAHERGVVHRDLKPSNVLVDPKGRPKLLDFGIAKQTRSALSPLPSLREGAPPETFQTAEGLVFGTPSYMPPEQHEGSNVDARADQFAWGTMAYEILGGVHPAETSRGSARGKVPMYPAALPRPLVELTRAVPEAVTATVHRAMSARPDDRFASMRDVVIALRNAEMGSAPTIALSTARSSTVKGGAKESPRSWRRRHWRVFLLSGASVLGIGAAILSQLPRLHARVEPATAAPASANASINMPDASSDLDAAAEQDATDEPMPTLSASTVVPPPRHAPRARTVQNVKVTARALYFRAEDHERVTKAVVDAGLLCLRTQPFPPNAYVRLEVPVFPQGNHAPAWVTALCTGSCSDPAIPWPVLECVAKQVNGIPFPMPSGYNTTVVIYDIVPE